MDSGSINVSNLFEKLRTKDRSMRVAIFIWGVLIYATAFSVFFSPRNIITGGSMGLSLIVRYIFGIDTSVTVFVVSFLLLILAYLLLGWYDTAKTVIGVILLPIFMDFSTVFIKFIDVSQSSLFLVVFFGGILMGLGNGLIIRSGYSVGGFQTLYQILYKYFGVSIGKSTLMINGVLIFVSIFFFDVTNALYAIIGLYVSSVVTDKVMLETSATKTFYIITDKDKIIRQYISQDLGYGVTMFNAKGGYSNENKKVLMCAVPTRQYVQVKEIIQKMDEDVFFLITDTYEICGGV